MSAIHTHIYTHVQVSIFDTTIQLKSFCIKYTILFLYPEFFSCIEYSIFAGSASLKPF